MQKLKKIAHSIDDDESSIAKFAMHSEPSGSSEPSESSEPAGSSGSETPETGDHSMTLVLPVVSVLALAILGAAILVLYQKKRV